MATWTDAHHIRCRRQVLILDTCYAGAATLDLNLRRADANEQGLGKLALTDLRESNSGLFVLMGCAPNASSYESSRYGEGLLTYALLSGLKGDKLDYREIVQTLLLLEYARGLTRDLAQGEGDRQEPELMRRVTSEAETGSASSFPLGRMTEAEKRAIALPQPHPLVARPAFLDRDTSEDGLKLSAEVRKRLAAASFVAGRGNEAAVVYVDVSSEDRPGAVVVSGGYTMQGEKVTLHLVLRRGDRRTEATLADDKSRIA